MAQTQSDRMVRDLSYYNEHHLEEKVYLHTDRSSYLCGEILWFKAYVEDAKNNRPLGLSKVLYVELLNASHEPVLQAKVGLQNGSGDGSLVLPVTLESGNYELRAYTNWMKNDAAFRYFRKVVTVVNTTRNLAPSLVDTATKYHADFFPEGGNLVNGLKSLVAFKIEDNAGRGADARGVLVDQSGDTVTSFKTTHAGMGNFYFTPEAGKIYQGLIELKDSSKLKKALPSAYPAGDVMHLSGDGNTLKISVASSGQMNPAIYLVAQTNRTIDYWQAAALTNGTAEFTIDKKLLRSGVTSITLFREDGQPVSERLYFKRPGNQLDIQLASDKTTYRKRQPVSVQLSTTGQSGPVLSGNLSASVYRLDERHGPEDADIYSYLWLSSDLKGYIEDPEYYFRQDDPQTNEALDNLLLTQGWRTFDWTKFPAEASPLSYVPENRGHIITGRVTDESTGKPAAGVLAYLSVPGRRVQLYGCLSDSDGMVHFDMKDFYGASQIVLQTGSHADSSYHLQVFSPFSEQYAEAPVPLLKVSEGWRESLQQEHLDMQVSNAYHLEELQRLAPLVIDTLPFYYKPYKTYLLDNYTRFTTMEEVLREYVLEVNVSKRDKRYHLQTFDAPGFALLNLQPSQKTFSQNPLVLLDGVPVFDMDKIMAYDPLKVQQLEVVASRYFWGPIKADGIVSFTTYKGNLPGYSLDPHDIILDYDGLQKKRIFYSPQYETPQQQQSRLPDFREVLYWSPDVVTDAEGKGRIAFYTGDLPGRYLVNVQGIAADGAAGSSSIIVNVSR